MSLPLLGALLALCSALFYGSSDFTGGFAARRGSPFFVLLISSLVSILLSGVSILLRAEPCMPLHDWLWSVLAGILGAFGVVILYYGLARNSSAVVAPASGLVGAALPALVGSLLEGLPGVGTLLGFLLALVGIWVVSNPQGGMAIKLNGGLKYGVLSGLGAGAYYIFISRVNDAFIFFPLLVINLTSLLTAALILFVRKTPAARMHFNRLAVLIGFLSFGGNLAYLLALQMTRMDIAAVLSSLFPAATVLLSVLILKERISARQWLGVIICLAAIVLIVL